MADEQKDNKVTHSAPAARKPARGVRLATARDEVFDLSAEGLGVVTSEGKDFNADDADKVRTLARKYGVGLTEVAPEEEK